MLQLRINFITNNVNGKTYKVHTFTSSGTFQITSGSGVVTYVVLAGGGGAGSGFTGSGGGGAGGLLEGTMELGVGSYTVSWRRWS